MMEDDANESSLEHGSSLDGNLVGVSRFRLPDVEPLIVSAIVLPLVAIGFECHNA